MDYQYASARQPSKLLIKFKPLSDMTRPAIDVANMAIKTMISPFIFTCQHLQCDEQSNKQHIYYSRDKFECFGKYHQILTSDPMKVVSSIRCSGSVVTYSPNALDFIRFSLDDNICLDPVIRAADVQFCLSSGLYASCASLFNL